MAKYAILSDIHSNWEALSAVLQKCGELAVDYYLSLGDIVGYNADPVRCLEAVRELNPMAMVRGNHDEYTAGNDEAMECFNDNARAAVLWTRAQLSGEQRRWLISQPYLNRVPSCNTTLVHSTLDSPDRWGYIFEEHHAQDNFSYQSTQLCFCGHSHVPMAFEKAVAIMCGRRLSELPQWCSRITLDELMEEPDFSREESFTVDIKNGYKYLFNVGSIGQPRNRDPRASFAVLDTSRRIVTRYVVPYDIELAQAKVLEAGLPERLAVRLSFGC